MEQGGHILCSCSVELSGEISAEVVEQGVGEILGGGGSNSGCAFELVS